MERASLLIKNVKVFNSFLKKFCPANVFVKDGRFYYIDRTCDARMDTAEVLDAGGAFMIPGLIDVHMHIESSMMTPGPFGRFLASCGVTTIVAEPHEMANVKGMQGIREMIQASDRDGIDIFYGIPSSVPSTSEALETTGGIIDAEAMQQLLNEKDVICVGEIMNCRGILNGDKLEITKFINELKQSRPDYIIEGHCPSFTGLDLARLLYYGIGSDHTEHNLEEVKQRIENGMFMEIQHKMLKPEVLAYICDNQLFEYCSFVTDDTMADVLFEKGQLNYVVEQAIKTGFPLEQAIYCATYTSARRMKLTDRGVIAPGKLADFMLLKDPAQIRPEIVYKNGKQIYSSREKRQQNKKAPSNTYRFPEDFYHSVLLDRKTPDEFCVYVDSSHLGTGSKGSESEVTVRVMEVQKCGTQTKEVHVKMPVKNGKLCWEESGCLLAVVFERHGKNHHAGYGFITGGCLKHGTAASTYFHDHHNLFVTGDNPADMCLAANRLIQLQGGILTAEKGKILAELPLPICGILSDCSVEETGNGLKKVRLSLEKQGYDNPNPIMSLCTLGLPVSPALKLTDKGLVDTKKGELVPLFV